MRLTLVHNPTAGDGSHAGKALVRMFEQHGHEVRRFSTKKDWERAFDDPGDAVVSAGGDGTVRRCVSLLRGSGVPLVILPLGAANNIAKSLGLMGGLERIAATLGTMWRRPLDLGLAQARGRTMSFVESLGGGVVSALIAGGKDIEKGGRELPGHELDRAVLALRRIVAGLKPKSWGVRVDGRDRSGSYLAVEVLNMRCVGPNLLLAPKAQPADDRLDVVLLRPDHRQAVLDHLDARLVGESRPLPLKRLLARRVILDAPARSLHLDDKLQEWARRTEVVALPDPGAITLLVPRGWKPPTARR